MNRTIWLILFFLTRVLGEGSVPAAAKAASQGKRIVAFGDGLVAGVGAKTNGLVEWLRLQTGLEIVNAGLAGDRAELALGRLERDVLALSPDFVILLLGGNDVLEKRFLYETRSDLFDIVRRIEETGARTVIVGLYSGLDEPYQQIFSDLYATTKSAFVPNILDGVSNPFLGEAYPSDEEYQIMAFRISSVLAAVVNVITAPVLKITYFTDGVGGTKVTLEWEADPTLSYDIVQGPPGTPVSGMKVLSNVSGASGLSHVTFSVAETSGFFALRVTRL